MKTPTGPRISLVIPARDEEALLPSLLKSVRVAAARFRGGRHALEVVVADNASTDGTVRVAREFGCTVVTTDSPSIAGVRNAGASASNAPILAWVDADSEVHPDVFNAIEATLTPEIIVGATGITMSRSSFGIAVTMLVVGAATRLLRVGPGVVFCRRGDWIAVHGYDEARRYAEDVDFQARLKRLGRTRGQGFAWARGVSTVSSARKYDEHGDWHAFTLFWRWIRGPRSFARFVQAYWYRSDE